MSVTDAKVETKVSPPPISGKIGPILDRLACPQCRVGFEWCDDGLRCNSCASVYPIIKQEIADLRPTDYRNKAEHKEWSHFWSLDRQRTVSQRFFSFYRKAVFARTVRYFHNRYMPSAGMCVEAGCGTSETSMRIDKLDGNKILVASDIVLPILTCCHPVMDVRLCADIFNLPFHDNSVDGIWNVGVMEHFSQPQIKQIMREFRRVLKPKAPVILLWPGTNSIPQKMLRLVENTINLRGGEETFRFHPEEISQLRSKREGRDILEQNGFQVKHLDNGFRSLMAFRTLVGVKL
jgi:ubiquinone/menaquinone biosynthesis C-methylase UbiE